MVDAIKTIDITEDPTVIDESELDKALALVRKHKRRATEEMYKLAGVLKRIRDDELWALRVEKKTGLPKYEGFYDFCNAEVQISEGYIRRLIAVCEQFSIKQLKEYGVTRLSFSLRVPERKRRDFLDETRMVPTNSDEIKSIANQLRDEPSAPQDFTNSENRVHVALPLGIKYEPMYDRPVVHRSSDDPHKPATSLVNEPWAEFQLTPLVYAHVRLTKNEKGELLAIFEVRQGRKQADAR